jgi:hypothetical protein
MPEQTGATSEFVGHAQATWSMPEPTDEGTQEPEKAEPTPEPEETEPKPE